ncbi:type VI secretion system protein TssA [soil metagenome]
MEIISKPAVINLDLMLQPISEENPAGESLRYTGIYDEIQEARRADEDLNQGEWKTELKVANFRKVIELSIPALEQDTKDLQIGAWFSEALVKEYGFVGLRDGLKLMSGLQDKFWETLHPEIEEGDMEGRANAIAAMDKQAAFAIKGAPITGLIGYSFNDWEDSKRFDIPDNIDTLDSSDQQKYNELKVQAEKENRITALKWRIELAQSRRVFYEELILLLDECWTEYNELNRINEEKYDRNQTPGLGNLKIALDNIQSQVKKLLEDKRAEEPDEVEAGAETAAVGDEGETVVRGVGVATASGAIQNRQDALKRLSDIAAFFQKTEPHSPIAYLVQRAVKWGNMPLEVWLQDVIKDETVIFQIRQTLGFNTQIPDSESSNPQ